MTASYEALLQSFNESLIVEKHVSSATRDSYLHEVTCFFNYLQSNSFDVSTVTTTNLMDYLVYRSEANHLSSRTLAKVITILRVFFRYVCSEKMREDDPTELIPKNKIHKKLPETADFDSIDKILEAIDTSDNIGLRDRAIFELIYSCGLRVSECANLKLNNYYNKEHRIIVTGKGNKQRMEPVGETAIYYLESYLKNSRPNLLKKKNSQYVFVTAVGVKITRQEIWERLKIYSKKVGIDIKVHTLRHSFATHMLRNGADLRSVQELLGHSDIRTTEIYTHVDTEKLFQEFEKAHPMEQKNK